MRCEDLNRFSPGEWKRTIATSSVVVYLWIGVVMLPFFGCDALPTDIALPRIQLEGELPLFEKTITLAELVKDSTGLLQKSQAGNIEFVQKGTLPTVSVSDILRFENLQSTQAFDLNSLSGLFSTLDKNSTATIGMDKLNPTLPLRGSSVLPPQNAPQQIEQPILTGKDFSRVQFSSGSVSILVDNRLPVPISLGKITGYSQVCFVLKTTGESDILIPLKSNQLQLPEGGSLGYSTSPGGVLSIPLTNVTISKETKICCAVFTSGSNGENRSWTESNAIEVGFRYSNVKVKSADIIPSGKTFGVETSCQLAEGIVLTSAQIQSFKLKFTLTNQLPIAGKATISVPQMIGPSGVMFSREIDVRERSNKVTDLIGDASGYSLVPAAGQSSYSSIGVNVTFTCEDEHRAQHVVETDAIKISTDVVKLEVTSANGKSLPALVKTFKQDLELSGTEFEGFTFSEISANGMRLQLDVRNGFPLEGKLSGTVDLLDESGTSIATLQCAQNRIEKSAQTSLSFPLGAVRFTSLPKRVRVDLTVEVSTDLPFSIAREQELATSAQFCLPLQLKITNGVLSGARERLLLTTETRSSIEQIQDAVFTLEYFNKLPATASATIHFFDDNGAETFVLPVGNPIELLSAEISADGYSKGETHGVTRLTLTSAEARKLAQAEWYQPKLHISTASKTDQVTFKTTDYVKMKSNVKFRFAVSN